MPPRGAGGTLESWTHPLRHGVFRAFWLASLVSNLGTMMQSVGAAWLTHMRLHQRPTLADRELEARAWAYHVGDRPPEIRHYFGEPL